MIERFEVNDATIKSLRNFARAEGTTEKGFKDMVQAICDRAFDKGINQWQDIAKMAAVNFINKLDFTPEDAAKEHYKEFPHPMV